MNNRGGLPRVADLRVDEVNLGLGIGTLTVAGGWWASSLRERKDANY